MAATKGEALSNNGASGTFAVGTNYTGTVVTISTQDYADAYITFTTGASAPTAAAVATLMVSVDNTTFYSAGSVASSLAVSTTITGTLPVPASAQYARVDVTGPAGYAVTGQAQIGYGTF